MKYVIVSPANPRSRKTFIARRGVRGRYHIIAECSTPENAEVVLQALNAEPAPVTLKVAA